MQTEMKTSIISMYFGFCFVGDSVQTTHSPMKQPRVKILET